MKAAGRRGAGHPRRARQPRRQVVERLLEGQVIAGVEHASTVDPIRDLVHGAAGLPVREDAGGALQLPGSDVDVRGHTRAVSAVANRIGEHLATGRPRRTGRAGGVLGPRPDVAPAVRLAAEPSWRRAGGGVPERPTQGQH